MSRQIRAEPAAVVDALADAPTVARVFVTCGDTDVSRAGSGARSARRGEAGQAKLCGAR